MLVRFLLDLIQFFRDDPHRYEEDLLKIYLQTHEYAPQFKNPGSIENREIFRKRTSRRLKIAIRNWPVCQRVRDR